MDRDFTKVFMVSCRFLKRQYPRSWYGIIICLDSKLYKLEYTDVLKPCENPGKLGDGVGMLGMLLAYSNFEML